MLVFKGDVYQGLDADTLDGIDSGSFLRSDATDISTQRISFKANTTNNWDTIATTSGGLGSIEVRNDGAGNDAFMAFHAAGDYAIYFGLDADANDLAVGGWSMGANKYKVWHAGNDGAGSGLDADLWDGNQFSSYLNQALLTSSSPQFANIYSSAWLRNNNTGQGLYNQANDAHFYSAGSEYWHINGNSENITSSGLVFYDRYQASQGNATGRKGYVYWDSNGFGLLGAAGQWAVNIRSTGTDVVFGGHTGNNHYDSVSSARISFGGGNDFANYSVGTSLENYGGNYTKLDLRWHTGIRIGAQAVYGGTRIFNNEDFSTLLFSVGRGDGNTRVESGNFRAPSYYDTDDTGYYINYNAGGNQILELNVGNKSTSYRRTTLHSSGKLTVAYGDNALHDVLYLKNNHMTAAGHGARIMWHLGNGGTQRNGPRIEGYAASNYSTDAHADSELRFYTTNDNSHVHVLRLRNTGNAEVLGNLYAPAVYDYNDSAYYLNPNGTSVLNAIAFGGAMSVTSGYAMQAGGAIHMNNRNINHVNQLHFHDGVRFVGMDNDQYLKYRWDDTGSGGIRFYDGNDTHHGYIYGDGNGRFGLLDNDGSWSYKAGLGSEALQLHCNGDLEFEVYQEEACISC